VAAITFFLFLAGYTIQQRSIADLQAQLKPRIPIAPLSRSAQTPLSGPQHPSRLFDPEQNAIISEHTATQEQPQLDWQKLAHVQLVTKHHDVCNTIMFFGDLARLKSPARRILLFPQAWAMEKQAAKHDLIDPYMDITRRLLRRAARRYNVELRPIATPAGQEDASLAHLWALTDLERVMMLQAPGLVQDAETLDYSNKNQVSQPKTSSSQHQPKKPIASSPQTPSKTSPPYLLRYTQLTSPLSISWPVSETYTMLRTPTKQHFSKHRISASTTLNFLVQSGKLIMRGLYKLVRKTRMRIGCGRKCMVSLRVGGMIFVGWDWRCGGSDAVII
jgi:hypothetical protein